MKATPARPNASHRIAALLTVAGITPTTVDGTYHRLRDGVTTSLWANSILAGLDSVAPPETLLHFMCLLQAQHLDQMIPSIGKGIVGPRIQDGYLVGTRQR